MTPTTRSQDEIVARIEAVKHRDYLGWKLEVLLPQLDFEHARPYLKPDTAAGEWAEALAEWDDVEVESNRYLQFAFGKAYDQRGISANRSIDKLAEFAWLRGADALAARMCDEDEYHSYGLPLLIAFAKEFGQPIPSEAGR